MHCGQQIPDGSKFCGHCGQSQSSKNTPSKPINQNPYGGQSLFGKQDHYTNSYQQNSSLADKAPSFLNYRICQIAISVLLLLQIIIYFIPVVKPKDDWAGMLLNIANDDWSILGIASVSNSSALIIITLILLLALCVFSFILVFLGRKKASVAFTIAGLLGMVWNLICICVFQYKINHDFLEEIKYLGIKMTRYPTLFFAILFIIVGIALTILAQILYSSEPNTQSPIQTQRNDFYF